MDTGKEDSKWHSGVASVDSVAEFAHITESMADQLRTCYRIWGRQFSLRRAIPTLPTAGPMGMAAPDIERVIAVSVVNRVVWFHTKGECTGPSPLSVPNDCGMSLVFRVHS